MVCPRMLHPDCESAIRKKKSAVPCGRGLNPFPCGKEETGSIITELRSFCIHVEIISHKKQQQRVCRFNCFRGNNKLLRNPRFIAGAAHPTLPSIVGSRMSNPAIPEMRYITA